MEEQPKGRAQERRYHHHGEDRNPVQLKTSLKNEQSHFQHQETQTKKTGNGKVNTSDVGGDKTLSADDTVGAPFAITNNGSRHLTSANARQKSTQKAYSIAFKVGYKDCMDQSMNISDDNATNFNHYDSQDLDKKESALLQNGVVNPFYITNGFSSKAALDNDGSGSEGGYTTPKKRKARRNSIKNTENVTRERERAMQQGNAIQEPEASLEPTETVLSLRLDGMKSAHKAEVHTVPRRTGVPDGSKGEPQRKNSDSKTAGASGKKFEDRPKAKMSSTKEDSWTLFKPPPVFPVDNSSAKIVPKISYASKVKENLNKAAQMGGEALPPQSPARLSQVPMSAMKTITSASFTNGPIPGDGNGCPSGGTFFASAASSIPPAPSLPCGENVASSLDNNCSPTNNPAAAFETRKCTLFIPLNPLNMQPVLPSARQVDNPAAQTNQKALGDIFQNQWGLSFINEPNVGPDGGSGQLTMEEKAMPVTFQGECTVVADQSCLDTSSSVPEPLSLAQENRTSTPSGTSIAHVPTTAKGEEGAKVHLSGQEKTKTEVKSSVASVVAPCNDSAAELAQTSLSNVVLGVSKELTVAHPKGLDRRCSWGSFDLKAAVTYHTKEMGYIINLQKQDPKRVVIYDGTQEEPDQ